MSVSPIFKGVSIEEWSNYQPLYVLPFLSHLFEKLLYCRLYRCFNVMDFAKSINRVFDHSIQLSYVYHQIPLSGIILWTIVNWQA